jgi:hypothetical protein
MGGMIQGKPRAWERARASNRTSYAKFVLTKPCLITADNPKVEMIQPTQTNPALHSSRTVKHFWLGGIALLTLLLTFVVGNFFLPQSKRLTGGMVGHDFLAFYTAGTFVRQGRTHDLYNLDKVKAFQHELAAHHHLEIGESFGPFWNPPFYAWVFVPLASLPYHTALAIWEAINAAALFIAIALLIRLLLALKQSSADTASNAAVDWRVWALIPLLMLTPMPLIQALTHGQNTLMSLLLICLSVTCWQNRHAFWAGAVSGLLLYKPQLGLLVAAAIVLTLGWRAALGLGMTGAAMLLVTLITLPGTISDYLSKMPGNLHQFQVEQVYLWDRHVTLRAFWRLLLQGCGAGEMTAMCKTFWLASCVLLAAFLAKAWWKRRKRQDSDQAPLIAAVITAMPLLMPFYFDYDLLLISVSAVCYAGIRLRERAAGIEPLAIDRWITRAWVMLYLWLMVNSSVARLTGVNGTVVLLSAVAGLLVCRATNARTSTKASKASQRLLTRSSAIPMCRDYDYTSSPSNS